MNRLFFRVSAAVLTLVLSACASDPINPVTRVRLGMSKAEVGEIIQDAPGLSVVRGDGIEREYYRHHFVQYRGGVVTAVYPFEATQGMRGPERLNPIESGMTQAEVQYLVGTPNRRASDQNNERWIYSLCTEKTELDFIAGCKKPEDYAIVMRSGVVVSSGRVVDLWH